MKKTQNAGGGQAFALFDAFASRCEKESLYKPAENGPHAVFAIKQAPFATLDRSLGSIGGDWIDRSGSTRKHQGGLTPIQEPLSIALAVKIALTNNPEIAATQWDVAAAENRHQAARVGR
ncbi:MAG: hypothetical protein R6X05_08460 [Desulfobacterales bacterium]